MAWGVSVPPGAKAAVPSDSGREASGGSLISWQGHRAGRTPGGRGPAVCSASGKAAPSRPPSPPTPAPSPQRALLGACKDLEGCGRTSHRLVPGMLPSPLSPCPQAWAGRRRAHLPALTYCSFCLGALPTELRRLGVCAPSQESQWGWAVCLTRGVSTSSGLCSHFTDGETGRVSELPKDS